MRAEGEHPAVGLDQWGTISDTGSLRVCLISMTLPITPPTDAVPSAQYPFHGFTNTTTT